jgi:hypothetical protein
MSCCISAICGLDFVDRFEAHVVLAGYVSDPPGNNEAGLILQLHIRDHRRIDHLINGLGLALLFLLELLDVAEGIHRGRATVGVVADEVPTRARGGPLVVALLLQRPVIPARVLLPVNTPEREVLRDRTEARFVGLDGLADHDLL